MANIRSNKRRIKSVQNISQITKAMEMVAASKMKKAQDIALMGKPYADRIYELTKEFAGKVDISLHPLLSSGNPEGKILLIVISSNKGLCGSLNTNLFRKIYNFIGTNRNFDCVSIGRKAASFLIKSKNNLIADFSDKQKFIDSVPAVTKIIVEGFINSKYKGVYIGYSNFINVLKQEPSIKMILPISSLGEEVHVSGSIAKKDIIIEPNFDEVLEFLLPHYLENQLRSAIHEGEASEHSARMIAMKNATDAALDFMESLTLIYNKARQEKITYEIADIVTARAAFE